MRFYFNQKNHEIMKITFTLIIGILILGLLIFTPFRTETKTIKTNPPEVKKSSPQRTTSHPVPEDLLTKLSSAKTKDDLLRELALALNTDEQKALLAFAQLESDFIEAHFYDFILLFTEHFGERYKPTEALDKLYVLSESKKNIFINTGLELLTISDYANKNSALEYLDFVNDERFSEITELSMTRIGIHMTEGEGGAALAFIEKIRDEKTRNRIYESALSNWGINDLSKALEHLHNQEASSQKNTIIGNLIGRIMIHDPHAAILWSEQINDSSLRETQILTIAEGWIDSEQYTEDYAIWKNSLQDESFIEKVEEAENRVAYKKEIRSIYNDSYNQILDGEVTGSHLIESFVNSLTEMEVLVQSEPDNQILNEEWQHLITNLHLKKNFHLIGEEYSDFAELLKRHPLP